MRWAVKTLVVMPLLLEVLFSVRTDICYEIRMVTLFVPADLRDQVEALKFEEILNFPEAPARLLASSNWKRVRSEV